MKKAIAIFLALGALTVLGGCSANLPGNASSAPGAVSEAGSAAAQTNASAPVSSKGAGSVSSKAATSSAYSNMQEEATASKIPKITNFNQTTAIAQIIGAFPDFPADPTKTNTKAAAVNGKTYKVTYTTRAVKDGGGYTITLKKDWNVKVKGVEVASTWWYRVTPTTVRQIDHSSSETLLTASGK